MVQTVDPRHHLRRKRCGGPECRCPQAVRIPQRAGAELEPGRRLHQFIATVVQFGDPASPVADIDRDLALPTQIEESTMDNSRGLTSGMRHPEHGHLYEELQQHGNQYRAEEGNGHRGRTHGNTGDGTLDLPFGRGLRRANAM
jgi:hypothetical protein